MKNLLTPEVRRDVFGWFEGGGEKPAQDPGRDGLCPFCCQRVGQDRPIKTVSFVVPKDTRSYFYRHHADCYNEEDAGLIESSVVDRIYS